MPFYPINRYNNANITKQYENFFYNDYTKKNVRGTVQEKCVEMYIDLLHILFELISEHD